MSDLREALDAAAAAREVATMTALALIQVNGDAGAALGLLADLEGVAPSESITELDCVTISAQAIRDAVSMRGELG